MADTTVAVNGLKAFQVARDLTSEITLEHPFVFGDDVENFVQLLLGQILRPHIGAEACFFDEEVGPRGSDAVDVTEGERDFLFRGDFYTEETWHVGLG